MSFISYSLHSVVMLFLEDFEDFEDIKDIEDVSLDPDSESETTITPFQNMDDIPDSWMDAIDDLPQHEKTASFPIKKHVVFSQVSLEVKPDGSKVLSEVITNQPRWLAGESMPEGWKFARKFDVCTPLDKILAVCSSSEPEIYHTKISSSPSYQNESPRRRRRKKGRKHSKKVKAVIPDN